MVVHLIMRQSLSTFFVHVPTELSVRGPTN